MSDLKEKMNQRLMKIYSIPIAEVKPKSVRRLKREQDQMMIDQKTAKLRQKIRQEMGMLKAIGF